MNKVILIGRNVKDIDLKYTANNNSQVAQFTIAVNRNFKNANGEYDADFINCIAFAKIAETIQKHIKKGDKLGVEGRLQVRNYQNKEGKTVYATEVIVENIEFLQPKTNAPERVKEEAELFELDEVDKTELPF